MEPGIYTAIYKGQDGLLGFSTNKQYVIEIKKKPNECYDIHELENDLYMTLASKMSIDRYWNFQDNENIN